ncbi:hypothetical protein EMIHUDRAFT_227525 [Emiliania huxleyi CCMP1516]|uniref:Prolyl 4-hydroxylase alpha subunit Fe(2+) 2OG dioxygenase domain-containing protein n=2 Tax=Emiliania huxleyi TaxID=2903 RepID=A0A0D3KHJ8_EMIH1|nr:hypothetical protein EMIHUDRAFT_227525 [Emiliania huxleyi CCMP1516]EOD35233.1 hypothetical protein EMIHUDRAFT_227525 [Emiliania huxleyi CCMP1516]|eukprot:XP_005787662.1 hypothetical protein EMIHUDRAFT_227525 [Emiliania huxleyi CCMP1516]
MMAESSSSPSHAFAVGERVHARVGAEWKMGTVVDLQSSEHGSAVTYEVKLDGTARVADGATLYVSDDANEIRVPCEVGSPANPKNARDSLTDLLQECTGTGSNYCVGGEWTAGVLPEITHQETGEFRYPLSAEQATAFITASQRSGVGTMTDTVINLEARKSWELLPADLNFVNHDEWEASVLLPMLAHISSSLDLDDWQLGASLYKMLVYEEGCFFRRHKDNVRIDNMWGTLVIQLPSVYAGAALRSARLKKQAEKAAAAACAASRRLKFAAFYADCQHEVDTLTGGLRCVLVYNLTGVPLEKTLAKKRGLSESEWRGAPSKLCASPPQPADEALVAKIAHALRALTRETDAHYPDETYTEEVNSYSRGKAPPAHEFWLKSLSADERAVYEYSFSSTETYGDNQKRVKAAFEQLPPSVATRFRALATAASFKEVTVKHGKPAKLVAVLSHFYTPQTLTGLHALKGRDRVVGELLVAALGCSRDVTAVPRLSALAASTLVVEDPPDYQALAKDSTAMAVVERAAFLSLVVLWDYGESTPDPPAFTFGPLIPLVPGATVPADLKSAVGPKLPNFDERGMRQLFQGEGINWADDEYDEYDEDPELYEYDNWWQIGEVRPSERCLNILAEELLLADAAVAKELRRGQDDSYREQALVTEGDPQRVEFLGNGCPYPGQCYARAAILFWPTEGRNEVLRQSPAGGKMLDAAGATH